MPGGFAQPSAFEQLLQKILGYAGPIVQILFWIALIIILFLAWRDFRRLVNHYVLCKKGRNADEVDLEEFVD
ncbi:MAG: hypothetical protein C4521_11390 [Actinobacteria bacterium]|nr:MAG: hypothetical protein C4521_11390 [Actinomycetota bacterium]